MLHTAEIPFVSSLHGRQRRLERGITTRDLKSAVKYGIKEKGFPDKNGVPRWRYTYGDIVYITDATSTVEVTSWALEMPLARVTIAEKYLVRQREASHRVALDPRSITSHTVLLVDMSGSMNKSDMNGHRSRARGVYYNLAMEFIEARLHTLESGLFGGPNIGHTDVVSLVEMRGSPTVVFRREPMSWVLFNKFVDLADAKDAHDHGNYYPSLAQAFDLFEEVETSKKCALAMFFFTDGKPSDYCTTYNFTPQEITANIMELVLVKCNQYRDRLTFTAFGFGKCEADFELLKGISAAAKIAGAISTFGYSYLDEYALADVLTATTTSLTKTRSLLSCLGGNSHVGHREGRIKNDKERANYNPEKDFCYDDWTFYDNNSSRTTVKKLKLAYVKVNSQFRPIWTECPMQPNSVGIAVSEKYFGEGAERIVFQMSEINNRYHFIGQPLVAKDSLYKHSQNNLKFKREWHESFIRIQMKAVTMADKFNAKLNGLNVSKDIPRIQFIPCCVYECQTESDPYHGKLENVYLSEKQLNPNNYKKWNNNAGGVDGVIRFNKIDYEAMSNAKVDINFITEKLGKSLNLLEEGDEDEDEDEEDDKIEEMEEKNNIINKKDEKFIGFGAENIGKNIESRVASSRVVEMEAKILECDIPQAFSHFTHMYSKRELMVCDIQGELSLINNYPVFELTDPCIHSLKKHGYGSTDLGRDGFQKFFSTHKCNTVCELLGFSNRSYNNHSGMK